MFSLGKPAGVVVGNSEVKSPKRVTNKLLAQNNLTSGENDQAGAVVARFGDDLDGAWCGRERMRDFSAIGINWEQNCR
jgi:hypothetical protein